MLLELHNFTLNFEPETLNYCSVKIQMAGGMNGHERLHCPLSTFPYQLISLKNSGQGQVIYCTRL